MRKGAGVLGVVLWGLGLLPGFATWAQDLNALKAGVVKITAQPPQGSPKVGTGLIIRQEEGLIYIVTAAHVVAGDQNPRVEFLTRRNVPVPASVLHLEGEDEVRGLALLVVRGNDNLPPGLRVLRLAPATGLSGGEDIVVIGFPRISAPWAVSKGSVVGRQGRDIDIDAAVDKGNSGGPVFMNGRVVGVVMTTRGKFARALTAYSVQGYIEGLGVQVVVAEGKTERTAPVAPTTPAPPASELPKEIVGKDGAPMVLIPAGEFMMGSRPGEGVGNEHPQKRVYLDAFYMDKYEVTTARYAKFLRATGRDKPEYWDQVNLNNHGNRPVVGVNWHDAKAYCEWAGKRLPTEAEWEKAARGTDGRRYPWGDSAPKSSLANYDRYVANSESDLYDGRLKDIDSYETGKSPYGLYNMAGNVWEWVADWYDSE